MERKKIRVLIADDHEIVRRGLRDMFETADDIVVVGDTDSVHSVPRLIQELSPDVLLMDLKWIDDESAGWIKIREVKKTFPTLRVIALTAHAHLMMDAWKAGADQVVSKNLRREEWLEVVRTVPLKTAPFQASAEPGRAMALSAREREVLVLVDKGLSDKEISKALNIEVDTTKNHVKSILHKLNAENRRKAAVKAREQKILE